MDLKEIQQLVRNGHYEVSFHAQQERLEEDLDLIQIEAGDHRAWRIAGRVS